MMFGSLFKTFKRTSKIKKVIPFYSLKTNLVTLFLKLIANATATKMYMYSAYKKCFCNCGFGLFHSTSYLDFIHFLLNTLFNEVYVSLSAQAKSVLEHFSHGDFLCRTLKSYINQWKSCFKSDSQRLEWIVSMTSVKALLQPSTTHRMSWTQRIGVVSGWTLLCWFSLQYLNIACFLVAFFGKRWIFYGSCMCTCTETTLDLINHWR